MLNIEWTLNEHWINNKISGIKLVFSLLNYQDDARPHKHKIRMIIFKKLTYINNIDEFYYR